MLRTRKTHFGFIVVRAATPEERERHGVGHVAEEMLDPALGAGQREDLLDAAEQARPGEMVTRQRILEVSREGKRILLEVDPGVVPVLARLEGRPMPVDRWLEALRRWVLAIDEQAVGTARWIVDVDQLGVRDDGRLVFGHGRLDSAVDTLWRPSWGEREMPPTVRSLVQLPWGKESPERAAVKELAFASMHLLAGTLPLEGLAPQEAMDAWQREDWRVPVPAGAERPWSVLSRALSLDAARRHEHVLDLVAELASASSAMVASAPTSRAAAPAPTSASEPSEDAIRRAKEVLAPIVRVGWRREVLLELASDRLWSRPELGRHLEGPTGHAWIERSVTAALDEALAQQARGAGEDCAKLDRAQRTLEAEGIVFRQGYGTSLRDGMELLAEEASERRQGGQAPRGMAFFDLPTIESAIETGVLLIYFAAVGGDPARALAIARDVQAALAAEGLLVSWTGVRADPLRIAPFAWHAPLSQSEQKLVV